MNAPFISVIIPTYNRAQKLDICLKCLANQSIARESFEVIVVDDGSTDDTEQILKNWQDGGLNLHVLSQKNSGQGVARNKAIKNALGVITVFIGDDIYVEPNFLELHANFHKDNPNENMACLGYIEWYNAKPVTPFMKWLTNGGPQFAFQKLTDGKQTNFWFFYTSNLSLKTDLLKKETFDKEFSLYGWEDIELGYRLQKNHKLKLIFKKDALAYHDHTLNEDSLEKRMQGIGRNAILFQKLHPELCVTPHGFKLFALLILASTPIVFMLKLFKNINVNFFGHYYWYVLGKRYFLKGLGKL
ncbi:MAG: glycosyltransferase family 2 protein [Candidatus Gracilibacteria bacterium]